MNMIVEIQSRNCLTW